MKRSSDGLGSIHCSSSLPNRGLILRQDRIIYREYTIVVSMPDGEVVALDDSARLPFNTLQKPKKGCRRRCAYFGYISGR
jgi:hypothetical protein